MKELQRGKTSAFTKRLSCTVVLIKEQRKLSLKFVHLPPEGLRDFKCFPPTSPSSTQLFGNIYPYYYKVLDYPALPLPPIAIAAI